MSEKADNNTDQKEAEQNEKAQLDKEELDKIADEDEEDLRQLKEVNSSYALSSIIFIIMHQILNYYYQVINKSYVLKFESCIRISYLILFKICDFK